MLYSGRNEHSLSPNAYARLHKYKKVIRGVIAINGLHRSAHTNFRVLYYLDNQLFPRMSYQNH